MILFSPSPTVVQYFTTFHQNYNLRERPSLSVIFQQLKGTKLSILREIPHEWNEAVSGMKTSLNYTQ